MENEEKKEQEIQEQTEEKAPESIPVESEQPEKEPADQEIPEQSSVSEESKTVETSEAETSETPKESDGSEESTESEESTKEEQEEDFILTGPEGEIFDPNSEFQWYFIQVLSGNEDKVTKIIKEIVKARKMENEITNVVVPKVEKLEKRGKSSEKKLVLKKMYPGYVLLRLRFNDENWNLIRNVNNVIDFVGGKYNPTSISKQEWEEIFLGKKKRKKEEIKVKFSMNEKVKITDGPFANFFGDIAEINEEKKHVKVMISIFGRLTPVELSYDEVEKI